jgi:hypothetical protein
MIGDPEAVERRIAEGQALIASRHSPAIIASQWLGCLLDVARSTGGAHAAG